MFYTVNENNGMIIMSRDSCPDPQEEADFFECPVYIIKGEHSGLSAEPKTKAPACSTCGNEIVQIGPY